MQRARRPRRVATCRRPAPGIRAAGGVVWRVRDGRIEVALVHRPRYDDWSLPKGKLRRRRDRARGRGARGRRGDRRRGRRRRGCSARVTLRRRDAGRKTVAYWAMRHLGGEFAPNDEVDELRLAAARRGARQAELRGRPRGARRLRRRCRCPTRRRCWCGTPRRQAPRVARRRRRPAAGRGGPAQAATLAAAAAGASARGGCCPPDWSRCRQTVAPLAERARRPGARTRRCSRDAASAARPGGDAGRAAATLAEARHGHCGLQPGRHDPGARSTSSARRRASDDPQGRGLGAVLRRRDRGRRPTTTTR